MAGSRPLSPSLPSFTSLLLLPLLLLPFFNLLEAKQQGEAHDHHPFQFLHQLVGSEKGANTAGLYQLKQYLSRFGYLNYPDHDRYYSTTNVDEDDSFDVLLESAIKTYQLNHNLKVTGKLDSETANQMMKPRCGVPDIINGTSSMNYGKKKASRAGSPFGHTVMHYSFTQGTWPSFKYHLTYAFLNNADYLRSVSARAFKSWQSVTQFTFEEVQDYNDADINIGFFSGDHGDGYSFDGQRGILAHAFPPTSGRMHLDADEMWSTSDDPTEGTTDLESVAVHEIGHLLGLGHTSVLGAVMYPSITEGTILRDLQMDDIEGIQALYNF